ncbi:MAG TPA: PfkB family carbohydrate kinase, partial [Kineosporiaceae bacterium]|nr:PfkB family carbohydrate kinase [Kineosporiaceae bacterium]
MHSSQRYGGDGGPPAGSVAPDPRLPVQLARAGLRVIVLGDAVLDGWFTGRTDRLCREGPVAVVDVERRRFTPGAAGNLAVNLAALGARTTLLARVGDDADGRRLCRDLDRAGVDGTGMVTEPGHATTTKVRVAASDQLLVRFDEHHPRPAPATTAGELLARLDAELGTADAVVVADYGLGLLGAPVRDHLARIRDRITLLVVDAHDCRRWARTRPDLVTPSAQEAARLVPGALSARGGDRAEAVEGVAGRLLRRCGARRA